MANASLSDTQMFFLCLAMVGTVSLLFFFHLVGKWMEINNKWSSCLEFRKKRKGSSNIRLRFDQNGVVTGESMNPIVNLDIWERVFDKLQALRRSRFVKSGEPELRALVNRAANIADGSAESMALALCVGTPDPNLLKTFREVDALFANILNG